MANEKIEIDIVLNDGSVAKGFANIQKQAQATEGFLNRAFSVFTGVQLSQAVNSIGSSLKGLFDDAIKEAIDGEEAINQLANSLRTAGTFSQDAVERFKSLADELQNTTKFSDDTVLSAASLARNFTKTNDQAEKLTRAAIELSAATGKDLNTSIEQLGGTFSGTAGRLTKLVPELGGLTEASLKSGAAIDIVLERFRGSAAAQVQTFAGVLAQARNQFNNFLEEVGNNVVRSPAIIALISEINSAFTEIGKSILGLNAGGSDFFKGFILTLASTARALNDLIIRPLEVIFNLSKVLFNQLKLLFDFFVAGIGKVAGAVGAVTKFFSKDSNLADSLLTFSESTGEAFINQAKVVGDDFANIISKSLDTGAADGIDSFLARIENAVAQTSGQLNQGAAGTDSPQGNRLPDSVVDTKALQEQGRALLDLQDKALDLRAEIIAAQQSLNFVDLTEEIQKIPDALEIASATNVSTLSAQLAALENFKTATLNAANQVNTAINNGIGNAISNGIQAAVNALANGENAFKAFAGAILNTFGDLAIQLGTFFITQGIASLALRFLDPTGAIAAGAGLVALGAIMKAFFGSKGKSSSKGAAPGSSLTPPLTPAQPVSGADNALNRPAVNVVVQGNIFDSDATGLRIATILKEQGFANAVRS